ncbi:MAG: hypothetical protein O7F73_03630 [Gammaproteobacteria bacterium]|nr:hypothetical protein [Gammaproteobacteria bacterium]
MAETILLDINDFGLGLWRGGEQLLYSPGYAYLQGRDYQYGESARGQARLHPREINHRFWWQLNTEPLQPGFGPARHSADLAHGHLLDLHQLSGRPERLILAVPGSMQREQLSLLLGIIEQCPFAAAGLVDRAIASVGDTPLAADSYYLELQLHQALLTRMTSSGERVQREAVTPIPGCGWLAVQDSMAQAIADAFIRQTRFDPRRKAATEQRLYNQLPQILEQLASQREYNLELDGHRVRLDQGGLAESCGKHYQRILQALTDPGVQLLLDPAIVLLPGLDAHFSNTVSLAAGSLSHSVEKHRGLITAENGDIHFITSLPATTMAPAPVPAPEAAPTPAQEPSRYRIEYAAGRYTLYPGAGQPPQVNGTAVTAPLQLRAGDVLDAGKGEVLQLVAAVNSDGTQT